MFHRIKFQYITRIIKYSKNIHTNTWKINIKNPPKQIRWNKKLFAVPGARYSSMFQVCGCVFCSVSFLFVYMCVYVSSSPRSIAGVSSSRVLPGFPVTAPPTVCIPDIIGALTVWRGKKKMNHIQETEYQSQNTITNCCPGSVVFIHVACLWMCVLFYFSCDCLHVYAYVFKYKVWLRAGHFRAALLLHTTRVRSWCNWRSNCVVV